MFPYYLDSIEFNDIDSALTMWETMKAADDLGYLLSATVDKKNYNDPTNNENDCGLVQ